MRAGLPQDAAQWIALAMSVAALLTAVARPVRRKATFVVAVAIAASLLSALYIAVYLHGGPRIIDATSYWLEGRALSEGFLSWPVDEPTFATLGRFLVRSDGLDGPRAAVIFPPGYPALLALGFLAGAPLVVGPLLAAALVVVTFDLGEQVAASLDRDRGSSAPSSTKPPGSPLSIAQIAALLSASCAALRYHTADTMSHGLSALCFAGSLALTLRALHALPQNPRRAIAIAAGAGLLVGWLSATRPVTSLALAATLALLLARERLASPGGRFRIGAAIALASLPGLALLAAHQRAATGAFAASSQNLYYALSDGPPGCFRYGFGANIGCLGEHGDFVRARLQGGYGAIEAALTTLRRLKMHLVDATNAEPLALLIPAGAVLGRRSPRALLLAVGVALVIAAYAPFYFDGNYPGGGARFFADVLPLEHVLVAVAAVEIARRSSPRLAGSVVALSLAGFALRAGFDHAALRDREGGRPMFEPARLTEAGVTSGLVFIDTDHGFNIAYDPAARSTGSGVAAVQIARFHGDALDRMTWEARGRPEAYRYRFHIPEDGGAATIAVEPVRFDLAAPLRIEGESLWPALAQDRAFAWPQHAYGTCASASRLLAVNARPDSRAETAARAKGSPSVVVSLPAPLIRGLTIAPIIALSEDAAGEIALLIDGSEARVWPVSAATLPFASRGGGLTCATLDAEPIPPGARRVELRIARSAPPPGASTSIAAVLALDRVEVGARKND